MTGETARHVRRWLSGATPALLFTFLTVLMTWPYSINVATHAVEHQDVFFNVWRLKWFLHALSTSPGELFDGNMFHPERRVFAFSDAMIVQGSLAAPLLWIGLPAVLVHNVLLLGAVAASGVGMYVLARHLSGSRYAAVVAGIVFAFAPYRVDHYMHMELQWAMWSPWAFWALHRTLETGARRFGIATGVFAALQMLSSIYYGVFLLLLLPLVAAIHFIRLPAHLLKTSLQSLAIGALIAVVISALYSVPYTTASARVGRRNVQEVAKYSATGDNYLAATPENAFYRLPPRGGPERRLFPGVLGTTLALAGVLLVRPSVTAVACLVGLAAAFELSLGMNGFLYPFLYGQSSVFRGLRAPARASLFCLLFLGVLSAIGFVAVSARLSPRVRRVFGMWCIGIVLMEYWVGPLRLVPYPNSPPPLYAWLARQPRGIVAEFPIPPQADALPGFDPRYVYMSTFHWMPLVNGYSGYYPPSYLQRLDALRRFPDATALGHLRYDGVRYVIVHSGGYSVEQFDAIRQTLTVNFGLARVAELDDGWGVGAVFGMR